MSGRFGNALKAIALGALLAVPMMGATAGSAAAHDDWRGGPGRGWDGPRHDRDWRDDRRWHREHRRHWREPRVIYAPPPVVYAPPPRVIYAPPPPPVVYAPSPGFGFSVNIR
ncbi:hypothetical protein [Azospirillum agricola]|uniref:hypothetical protein n=1 Tax=Azospirillum agricola TaxID=1720247 RepID=UPI000A0EEBF8|nr:hypothetical protein [Azospirillum agricola]SMH48075.1 hypothetical protein SAMN02982994_2736 [Azospirillum lipoferum]